MRQRLLDLEENAAFPPIVEGWRYEVRSFPNADESERQRQEMERLIDSLSENLDSVCEYCQDRCKCKRNDD